MAKLAVVLVLAAVVLVGAVVLAGCADADREAASRAHAEAALVRAEGQAYAERVRADSRAEAERSLVRQSERDAAHVRVLELLPFLALVLGAVVLVGFGAFAAWDIRTLRRAPADPAVLLYLERLRLEQAQVWRAVGELERRRLRQGAGEVVVYGRDGRRRR